MLSINPRSAGKSVKLTWNLTLSVSLLLIGIASAQDVVLGGTIVTPEKVIPHGWIVVKAGIIQSIVTESQPQGEDSVVETHGIIYPGLIDLHNHPMYNIFERWKPAGRFKNRYEWRDLPQYNTLVGKPGGDLQNTDDSTFCDVDEYSEVRALIGGTTAITGTSKRRTKDIPSCIDGLVRNLDWASDFYGHTVGHERIKNALGVAPRDMRNSDAAALRDDLANSKIDLLLIHLAEGAPLDMESSLELQALKGRGLLSSHTAIIHGTALSSDDFQELHDAGAAVIWSPRSNLELYGVTTDVVSALKQNVTVALAPDWSPTGSTNLLSEIRFASKYTHDQLSGAISDKDLLEMASSIPARIAHIQNKVGALAPQLYADLFVLKGDASDPYSALTHSHTADLQLVMIGGVALYGSDFLMKQFKVSTEAVDLCGAPMVLNVGQLPNGKLSDAVGRMQALLTGMNLRLAPLAECE